MGGSHLEQLQERVGERLGILLIAVGAIALILGVGWLAGNNWGYATHSDSYWDS